MFSAFAYNMLYIMFSWVYGLEKPWLAAEMSDLLTKLSLQ